MVSIDRIVWKGTLAAVALLGLGGTAMAQSTVVRAGGPSARTYPVGKSLAAGAKITLAAGDTLTVLDAKGTRTLRGPGVFSASGAASTPDMRNSFTSLVSTQNRRQARTGAVRAPEPGKPAIRRSPNIWLVDVQKSGTICLANPAAASLWRPQIEMAQSLMLKDNGSGKSATLNWPVGRAEMAWPATLPATDGGSYTLSWANGGSNAPVTIKLVNFGTQAASDPATLAAALHERGCTAQFDLLAAGLEAGGAAGS